MPIFWSRRAADPTAREHAQAEAKAQAKVERQITATLREMEHHGEGLANTANGFAVLLLTVFSAGSLISLSLEAFTRFMAALAAGHADLPDGLNVALNLLLVIGMDLAMFYAASVIRALMNSGGETREMLVHIAIIIMASLLETGTYIYLVIQYDRPTNGWLWAIGIGRAICAPLFAMYLSLARKLPIAPRDIAYYTALLAGKGVIHDVAVMAGDRAAPLARKVAIYTASATMKPSDSARFEQIIAAVEGRAEGRAEGKKQEQPAPAPTPDPLPFPIHPAPAQPQRRQRHDGDGEEEEEGHPALAPAARASATASTASASTTRQPTRASARNARQQNRGLGSGLGRTGLPTYPTTNGLPSGMGQPAPLTTPLSRVALRARREEAARAILADAPNISSRELARRVAMATHNRISEASARALRDLILNAGAGAGEEERDSALIATPAPTSRPALHVITPQQQQFASADNGENDDDSENDDEEQRREQ